MRHFRPPGSGAPLPPQMPQQPPLTCFLPPNPRWRFTGPRPPQARSAPRRSTRYGWRLAPATAADVVFAVFSRDGRAALLLALEVIGHGPFRVARFLGGSHANGNFPLCSRSSHPIDAGEIAALIGALADRPTRSFVLRAYAAQLGGAANPLLLLPATPSPNVALAADTGGGFEALLGG